jgi:hypothetical protein
MIKNKDKNELLVKNEINNYESLENFIKDSKELFNELTFLDEENIINDNKNIIFRHLSYIQFGFFVLPYLSLKDILVLRQTSKEINVLVNSKICCLNYYFKIFTNNNYFGDKNNTNKKSSKQLKPLEELNEESEFLEQKNILNNIKSYIKSPDFSIKHLTKIYKVEMDYLKYEESHQIRYMKSLNEIKNKMMNEYKMIKNKEEINKNKIVIVSKEENELFNKNGFEDIKKKIDELKLKKENILFKLNKEKKINEDLIRRNNDKNKIINTLKNICLNGNDFFDPKNQEGDNEDNEIDNINK